MTELGKQKRAASRIAFLNGHTLSANGLICGSQRWNDDGADEAWSECALCHQTITVCVGLPPEGTLINTKCSGGNQ